MGASVTTKDFSHVNSEAMRHMLEFLGWLITGDGQLDPNVRHSIERWARH